jgi:hypothetical protein
MPARKTPSVRNLVYIVLPSLFCWLRSFCAWYLTEPDGDNQVAGGGNGGFLGGEGSAALTACLQMTFVRPRNDGSWRESVLGGGEVRLESVRRMETWSREEDNHHGRGVI